MRFPALIAAAIAFAAPAWAQHTGHQMPAKADDPHAGHQMPANTDDPHTGHQMPAKADDPHAGHQVDSGDASPPLAPPPAEALAGPAHAADTVFDTSAMRHAREQLRAENGDIVTYKVMVDELETRVHHGRDGYRWNAQAWLGGDIDKLWIKTEGEGTYGVQAEQAEVQALWSHALTPWFDVQAGARYDVRPEPRRGYGVVGIEGLVPYMFEVGAAAFVSNKGDVSARLEGEYDFLITQQLILQPRAEVNLAVQEVRELGIGSGLSDATFDLRLRYEVAREFAPYIGISYERKFGKTADFARDDGEDADDIFFVLGVRAWF